MSAIVYASDEQAQEAWTLGETVLGCVNCGCKWTPESLKRLADVDCPRCGSIYTSVGFMHAEAW
jgi:hypothetical protein